MGNSCAMLGPIFKLKSAHGQNMSLLKSAQFVLTSQSNLSNSLKVPILRSRSSQRSAPFQEKATILHAESTRPNDEPMPPRLARHAYDLHQLMTSTIGKTALEEIELLARVAKHKAFFYPQAGVDYEQAYSGDLKIVPKDPGRMN